MEKKLAVLMIIIIGLSGCADEKPIGGETDVHGCLSAAGYTWCESKQKCLRTWEESCEGMVRSFKECVDLGYDVMESYPRQCKTPEGDVFTEDIEEPVDDKGQEIAMQIAENYVKNTKEYMEENGRNLKTVNIIQMRCIGCWHIAFQYDLDLGKPTDIYTNDRVTINLTLNEWNVVDVVFGRGGVSILTDEECRASGGRSVNIVGGTTCNDDEKNTGEVNDFISPNICCVLLKEPVELTFEEAKAIATKSECIDKGDLTETYNYNEYTSTGWIDLAMKQEFEKEECNPACVVNEKTKQAEINWRCTGLIIE